MPKKHRQKPTTEVLRGPGLLTVEHADPAVAVDYWVKIRTASSGRFEAVGWIAIELPSLKDVVRGSPAATLTLADGRRLSVRFTPILGVFTSLDPSPA